MRFVLPALTSGRLLVAAAFAAAAAALSAAAEPPPLRVSDNGRSLVRGANGEPVFLLADTAWSLALRLDRDDAGHYLRTRREQGFDAVTFVLFAPGRTELTTPAGTNAYGDVPFESTAGRLDPAKPITTPGADPADPRQYDYWDHVDHVVRAARRVGLYAILLPTWGSGIAGSHNGMDTTDIVFDAANARTYGEWLARRYRSEPHVLWMMGGDRAAVAGERDFRPVIRAMAAAFAAIAPEQLISYHPRKGAPQSGAWFHDDPWLAFNSNQEWPDQQVRVLAEDWARTPPKPTWLFEGRYEGYWKSNYKAEDWGDWQIRQQAYQTVLTGAFGHTYGHERVFGFGYDGADWKSHLDSPGVRSMAHLAALMARLGPGQFHPRVPDQSLLDGQPPRPERVRSDYIAAMRIGAGRALFYTASGRPVRVKLDRLGNNGPWFAFWFDPRRGTWRTEAGEQREPKPFARVPAPAAAAPARAFSPPTQGDGQDWVLLLSRSERL